jgi:hypothetical protein
MGDTPIVAAAAHQTICVFCQIVIILNFEPLTRDHNAYIVKLFVMIIVANIKKGYLKCMKTV